MITSKDSIVYTAKFKTKKAFKLACRLINGAKTEENKTIVFYGDVEKVKNIFIENGLKFEIDHYQ
jgi:hypothetical protein